MPEVEEVLNEFIWTNEAGDVINDMVFGVLVLFKWILDLRIGWEYCSLWTTFWRREISRALETRRARTATPVPPGTAWPQLYSVPPTS